MHNKNIIEDPYEAQAAIKQLIELGYIAQPNKNINTTVENIITETKYNLARVHIGAAKYKDAIPLLEELDVKQSGEWRFAQRLISCYLEMNNIEKANILIENTRKILQNKLIDNTEIETLKTEIEQIKAKEKLSKEEQKQIEEKNQKFIQNNTIVSALFDINIVKADILRKEKKLDEALRIYKSIKTHSKRSKLIHQRIGDVLLELKKYNESHDAFTEVIAIDEHNQNAHLGAAIASYYLNNFEQSASEALNAIELNYYMPRAHNYLALSLVKLEEYEQAVQAFEVCLTMIPDFGIARNQLIDLYENYLNQPYKAQYHKQFFIKRETKIAGETVDKPEKTERKRPQKSKPVSSQQGLTANELEISNKEQPIVIVSGLPRSGTSMMMQMLANAGLEILTDNKRQADESNPKGYFEYEAVKNMANDPRWIMDAKGKAVKVISHLLFSLPARFNYKIIFMLRDINEILLSQQKMLLQQGKTTKMSYNLGIEAAYKKNLEQVEYWNEKNHNVELLYVSYREVIETPKLAVQKVCDFLSGEFDTEKMAQAVDKLLYRQKTKTQ
jgi:tetratricopeptide (TPR) repeat protein